MNSEALEQVATTAAASIVVSKAIDTMFNLYHGRFVIVILTMAYFGGLLGRFIGTKLANQIEDYKNQRV